MKMLLLLMFNLIQLTSCKLQDLSWPMDMDHISYVPLFEGPEYQYIYQVKHSGPFEGLGGEVSFVVFGSYSTGEHMGTHMDAPYHFFEDGKTIDEIPLEDLQGPLVRINIDEKVVEDSDAAVEVKDLEDWEAKYGEIPPRAFVLMYSGWDKYYGDNNKYIGFNNETGVHYPGFSESAAKWLITNRDILGVGVDTVSCDTGAGVVNAHLVILPANKLCAENLKDIGKVPDCGAKFMMFPIGLKRGSGSQGRAMAEWYPGYGYMTTCRGSLKKIEGNFGTNGADNSMNPIILAAITQCLILMYRLM